LIKEHSANDQGTYSGNIQSGSDGSGVSTFAVIGNIFRERSANDHLIRGTYSRKIHGMIREHQSGSDSSGVSTFVATGDIFRKHSANDHLIREHSGNDQGTYSGNDQKIIREQPKSRNI
jgi:hypothetical protein